MKKICLKLFITGRTIRADNAIKNLHKIREGFLQYHFEILIFDVLENPEMAEIEKILATPTLIIESPTPVRRIIGDLSNYEKVIEWMKLCSNSKINHIDKSNM